MLSLSCVTASAQVSLQPYPSIPLIEVHDGRQLLNFDIAATNTGREILRLSEIEMTIFDSNNKFVLRKTVNSDGLSPGVDVVTKPLLLPGEAIDVFNPFFSIDADVPIARMEFTFHYRRENNATERDQNRHRLPLDFDVSTKLAIAPTRYQPKTNLVLPLQGRLFVWEGHDFFAHHRRVPLHAPKAAELGIRANANRYASDLVIIDDKGNMYRGDPWYKKNWLTYGAPIYAPADGVVVASENRFPDNEFAGKQIKYPTPPEGADEDLGNYVLIDHGNGEFSFLPHMMPGSGLVKKGDHVRQGQLIGRVGFSGDAIFPHVHYSLLSCGDIHACEGLPANFHHVKRILGAKTIADEFAVMETGNVVESVAEYK